MIDHSLLNPALDDPAIAEGCDLAMAFDVASVCVVPYALAQCSKRLEGSDVLPTTVVGFPHGSQTTEVKLADVSRGLRDGAKELDMVVCIGKVLSGDWGYVEREIGQVLSEIHAAGAKLKVIFENAYLQDAHKIRLCEICGGLGVDWVKTSTGYAPGGATDEDLKLMRLHSPPNVQVKAAGGVRTLDRLLEVRAIGVTRSGATATVTILNEARSRLSLPAIPWPVG
ncbi:MAG: deoxyribose-phosphate aldolase [Armatimonadetes bacterium]|nr:deoxyribose-phosphate aldolase [Armatimonadota bacterium]